MDFSSNELSLEVMLLLAGEEFRILRRSCRRF
jgi:hypothetical protein